MVKQDQKKLNHAGHSTRHPPILKQQSAMGTGTGISRAQVYIASCKTLHLVQNNSGFRPSNKGTLRQA